MEHAEHTPSFLDAKHPVLKILRDTKKAIEDCLLAEEGPVKERFEKDRARWEIYWDELKDKSGALDTMLGTIRYFALGPRERTADDIHRLDVLAEQL